MRLLRSHRWLATAYARRRHVTTTIRLGMRRLRKRDACCTAHINHSPGGRSATVRLMRRHGCITIHMARPRRGWVYPSAHRLSSQIAIDRGSIASQMARPGRLRGCPSLNLVLASLPLALACGKIWVWSEKPLRGSIKLGSRGPVVLYQVTDWWSQGRSSARSGIACVCTSLRSVTCRVGGERPYGRSILGHRHHFCAVDAIVLCLMLRDFCDVERMLEVSAARQSMSDDPDISMSERHGGVCSLWTYS